VLARALTAGVGDETLRAGDSVTILHGLDQRVRYDTLKVTFLVQLRPAGFAHVIHELSEPAQARNTAARSG
jgi:hypothetical protein